MRLIDVDALEKELEIADCCTKCKHRDGKCQNAFEVKEYTIGDICVLLGDAPTVIDPLPYYKECDNCKGATNYKPIKGKWLNVEHNVILEYTEIYKCSCCGFTIQVRPEMLVEDHKYCSRCGADMRGDQNA